jgi:hypothetical protein
LTSVIPWCVHTVCVCVCACTMFCVPEMYLRAKDWVMNYMNHDSLPL